MIVSYADQISSGFYQVISDYDESGTAGRARYGRLFQGGSDYPSLRNHPLRGRMHGKRSISVSDDLRIIFTERGGYTYILVLDVGTHDEVYE